MSNHGRECDFVRGGQRPLPLQSRRWGICSPGSARGREHAVKQVDSGRLDTPSLRMSGVVHTAVTTGRETKFAFGRIVAVYVRVAYPEPVECAG